MTTEPYLAGAAATAEAAHVPEGTSAVIEVREDGLGGL
jgi:hypothetical protein